LASGHLCRRTRASLVFALRAASGRLRPALTGTATKGVNKLFNGKKDG
jgi:hypothetical protein